MKRKNRALLKPGTYTKICATVEPGQTQYQKRSNIKITVTFDRSTTELLACVARQSKNSIVNLVEKLTLEALESREEAYLAKIAERLDIQNVKSYTHDQAWLTKRCS